MQEFHKNDIVTFEGRPLCSSTACDPTLREPVPGEFGIVEHASGTAVWVLFPYIPARYCMFAQILKLVGNPEQQIAQERLWPKGLTRQIKISLDMT